MIERTHPLPVTGQARLLGLARSSVYYRPVESAERDLDLMAAIDLIHIELPLYGARRIRNELLARGLACGRGHVVTLMRRMGITAIAPKRRLSGPAPGHKIYPYPLRGLSITEAGHVWSCDVTCLPPARGFCYLTAIMDSASRRVLSWRLSNTLDASFCIEALEEALARYDAPLIFNTDSEYVLTSFLAWSDPNTDRRERMCGAVCPWWPDPHSDRPHPCHSPDVSATRGSRSRFRPRPMHVT